jgi:hypothetical protein
LVLPSVPWDVVHVQAPVQARDRQLMHRDEFVCTELRRHLSRSDSRPSDIAMMIRTTLTIAFHVNNLLSACSPDAVYGRLVQRNDKCGGHGVVPASTQSAQCSLLQTNDRRDKLIVGIEDDPAVVLVLRSNSLPPLAESSGIGNDLLVVPSVVVRLDHGVGASTGDVVDLLSQVAQISWIRCATHAGGYQTFHVEVDPEGVEAFCNEGVVCRQGRPDKLLAISAWEDAVAKLGATLVDADPLHLASSFGEFAGCSEYQAHRAHSAEQ